LANKNQSIAGRNSFLLAFLVFGTTLLSQQSAPAAKQTTTVQPKFSDVTSALDLHFQHIASHTSKKYLIETMGSGVALFDYDNDGRLDIFVVNGAPLSDPTPKGTIPQKTRPEHWNRLFHQKPDGTFEDVTEKAGLQGVGYGMGVAVGDFDNDGYEDLYVTSYGGNKLYHNNGDGTFTDVSKKAGVSDPNGYYGMGVICSDFDEDGFVDIFVANDSSPNFLYHNNGDGTFKEIGFSSGTAVNGEGREQGSMGVTVADYDHDGRLDLFITNFDDEYNVLYHNDGKNSFTDVSYAAKVAEVSLPYVGWGTKFFDYDNDGWVDLFVANGHAYPQRDHYRQREFLFHNNRDGTFSEVANQAGSALLEERVGRGVAFGDIDNDGDVDIVVADLDGSPQLLRNDGGERNNSVLIKTVGVKSNRDGIGARVKIVSGDLTQIDEVHSGGCYLSQSDLRLHFGLEKRSKVDLIEVHWPSGAVDKVTNVGANKILTIKEGQGLVEQKNLKK